MWIFIIATTTVVTIGLIIKKFSKELKSIFSGLTTNYLSKSLLQVNKDHYIISYPYGVNWYKIIVPKNRKPIIINSILDGENINISDKVLPYLGPGYNCHGLMITPKMLGYSKITINYGINSVEKTFDENVPLLL